MRLTTLNSKNPNYAENHDIYVGTHTGSFKRISVWSDTPHVQQNLVDLKQLKGNSRITALEYGDEDKNRILLGRVNNIVDTYENFSNGFTGREELPEGPVVGVATYNGKLVAGAASGKIFVGSESDWKELQAGDNLSRLRQCPVDRKLIATGGKDRQNNLKIFDLERMEKVFTTKNLPNDFLQLEVPVWDSDCGFIDASLIATCSRYGYVRLYDSRKQRKPVQKYANDDQMSFSCLVARDNMIYVGTTMGALKAFDTRNFKNFVHTYKGFTGGLSNLSLDDSGKFLASSCLDRYVRVHHVESCVMMYQSYVKSKATAVLVKTVQGSEKSRSKKNVEEANAEVVEANESDDEYNAMFDKMQTVSENDETLQGNVKSKKKRKNNHTEKTSKKKKV